MSDDYYAETYDEPVPDWPGEVDFYLGMGADLKARGLAVLEIACGTGRIAIRLAQAGVETVGLDLSPTMLQIARRKSADLVNVRWVAGDMRSFELGTTFGLVIIPGHSFQNLNEPAEQVACLECVKRHLTPGRSLVLHLDHQDVVWVGNLTRDKGGVFETAGGVQASEVGPPGAGFPGVVVRTQQSERDRADYLGGVRRQWTGGRPQGDHAPPSALPIPVRGGAPAGPGRVRGRGALRGLLQESTTGRQFGDDLGGACILRGRAPGSTGLPIQPPTRGPVAEAGSSRLLGWS
jgi:SAM-dependent methyltransferase